MLLANRLQSVANLVGEYRRIADIGSDHARLPVWLVQSGKIDFAVAGEVQPGPLKAACRTIDEYGLENSIDVRLGDGLQVVAPDEVDVVVLAGMGGAAIRGILARSPEVVDRLKKIVCQPMTGAGSLRKWLLEQGWKIDSEDLVFEDALLYEVFSVVPADSDALSLSAQLDELLLEVGPLLWSTRHPLLELQLYKLIEQYQKRVDEMVNSRSVEVNRQRMIWEQKIVALEAMRACL